MHHRLLSVQLRRQLLQRGGGADLGEWRDRRARVHLAGVREAARGDGERRESSGGAHFSILQPRRAVGGGGGLRGGAVARRAPRRRDCADAQGAHLQVEAGAVLGAGAGGRGGEWRDRRGHVVQGAHASPQGGHQLRQVPPVPHRPDGGRDGRLQRLLAPVPGALARAIRGMAAHCAADVLQLAARGRSGDLRAYLIPRPGRRRARLAVGVCRRAQLAQARALVRADPTTCVDAGLRQGEGRGRQLSRQVEVVVEGEQLRQARREARGRDGRCGAVPEAADTCSGHRPPQVRAGEARPCDDRRVDTADLRIVEATVGRGVQGVGRGRRWVHRLQRVCLVLRRVPELARPVHPRLRVHCGGPGTDRKGDRYGQVRPHQLLSIPQLIPDAGRGGSRVLGVARSARQPRGHRAHMQHYMGE
mmetsp:Transcript_39382/g.90481  ORF Transcript_39382/g.90481 Transcript_39382/m.90481 type:complete len:418 (+) Transcript_39382:1992-3245(+)